MKTEFEKRYYYFNLKEKFINKIYYMPKNQFECEAKHTIIFY
jgi:hypothetical protein